MLVNDDLRDLGGIHRHVLAGGNTRVDDSS